MKSVSASQIRNWQQCPRKWYFEKVADFPVTTSPQQLIGQDIHDKLEKHLKYGEALEDAASREAVALLPIYRRLFFLTEYPTNYNLDFHVADVPVRGRLDVLDLQNLRAGVVDIYDFKTTSSFEYMKTEEELARDVQMVLYGAWAQHRLRVPYVRLSHVYVHKKKPQAKLVSTELLDTAHVQSVFSGITTVVEKMKVSYGASNHYDVPKNTSACFAYGKQCEFFDICDSPTKTKDLKQQLEDKNMDFIEKLKAKANAAAEPPSASPPPAEAPTLPDTTTLGDLELYVDCMDVKATQVLRLEDEILKRTPAVLRWVAAKERRPEFENVLDVREIPYGAGTAALLADFKRSPPTGKVVASSVGLSAQVIEVLSPLATRVIRATR